MRAITCFAFAAAKSTPIKDKEMAQTYEQLGGDGKIQQLIDSKRLRPTDQVRLAAERIAMFNEPEEFESLIKEYIGPNVEKRA
ncbi:hypothetical protein HY310_01510 [Candidatus Microgenomates bacterium]|nr:hypothetical protein [Candidatus Microgenomates bacterium]